MTQTPVAPEPRKQRQKAMARAGAAITVMIGPEVEMKTMATPSHARSTAGGRPRVVAGGGAVDTPATVAFGRDDQHRDPCFPGPLGRSWGF